MTPPPKNFGERVSDIVEQRRRRGYTVERIASQFGVSTSTLYAWQKREDAPHPEAEQKVRRREYYETTERPRHQYERRERYDFEAGDTPTIEDIHGSPEFADQSGLRALEEDDTFREYIESGNRITLDFYAVQDERGNVSLRLGTPPAALREYVIDAVSYPDVCFEDWAEFKSLYWEAFREMYE